MTTRTDAGNSYLIVSLNDTDNYCWNDGTVDSLRYTFSIAKADPDFTLPVSLAATAGTRLGEVQLPQGWAWDNPSAKASAKQAKYAATFTPADTANYNVLSIELAVKVTSAVVDGGSGNSSVSSDTGFVMDVDLGVQKLDKADKYDFTPQAVMDTVADTVAKSGEVDIVSVYDVNLTSGGSGVTVSQATDGGTIKVTLDIPDELTGKTFHIVHIHNGEIVGVLSEGKGYTVGGRSVSFEVDQLSQFVFVVEQPGRASIASIVVFAVLDALLVAVFVFAIVNKNKKKNAEA